MDYLIYVEHDAENLQFYLWYRSYVERFNALPSHQQRLSPPWTAERKDITQHQNRKRTENLSELLQNFNTTDTTLFESDNTTRDASLSMVKDEVASISPSPTSSAFESSGGGGRGMRWQPCTFSLSPFPQGHQD